MRLRIRRRLIGVPLAAAIVYFFATNSQVVWLYLISAMLVAMAALGAAGPAVTLRRLRLECIGMTREGFLAPLPQDRGKAFAGDLVRLHVRYRGDPFRVQFGPAILDDGSRWPVELEASRDGLITLAGRVERRGELRIEQLVIASRWPIGILDGERRLNLKRQILVHPRYGLPAASEQRGANAGLEEAIEPGVGGDFVGVREYRPGDGLRRIHWPTTARRNSLMVVETARESQTPARYQLSLTDDAAVPAVELAVSLVASLAAGRAAGSQPFRLHLHGVGFGIQRWPEALAALARVSRTSARNEPATRYRAAGEIDIRISAERDAVAVQTRQHELRLSPSGGLDRALVAVAELT